MEDFYVDEDLRERMMVILELSRDVHSPQGFFLWTQGVVQALLPHEILICCMKAGPGRIGCQRWFSSSRYFTQEHFDAAIHSETGVVWSLMAEWFANRQAKLLLPGAMDKEMENLLAKLELRNLVAHGVRGWEPDSGGFFLFARTKLEDSFRTRFLLAILVPYIHTTFSRVLAEENGAEQGPSGATVTPRELEILYWIKEGKRTGDIAAHLELSPFTVRNHVKNIFRKLGVKSRSHAVARAMSLGLLLHDPRR